jgi:hypothetical protein
MVPETVVTSWDRQSVVSMVPETVVTLWDCQSVVSKVAKTAVPKVTEMAPGMALAMGSPKAMKAPKMEPLMGARMAPLIEIMKASEMEPLMGARMALLIEVRWDDVMDIAKRYWWAPPTALPWVVTAQRIASLKVPWKA